MSDNKIDLNHIILKKDEVAIVVIPDDVLENFDPNKVDLGDGMKDRIIFVSENFDIKTIKRSELNNGST